MDNQEHAKNDPSNPTRKLPSRVLGVILVALLLAFLLWLFIPAFTTPLGPVNTTQDLSNIKQIMNSVIAYAIDNEGQLPEHIDLLSEYLGSDECLISPFDDSDTIPLEVEHSSPNIWYRYGSYWFSPAIGVKFESIESNDRYIFVYREPRPDSDHFIVGFLDGHTEMMEKSAFANLMAEQKKFIRLQSFGVQ